MAACQDTFGSRAAELAYGVLQSSMPAQSRLTNVKWVQCRWLDPVIFVMGAAFDTLDVERARVATDTPKREGSIGWSASEDLRLSPWNPKQWARLILGFHGWRRR